MQSCPICQLTITDSALENHVNACLDRQTTLETAETPVAAPAAAQFRLGATRCPVCGQPLGDWLIAAQERHINDCLDAKEEDENFVNHAVAQFTAVRPSASKGDSYSEARCFMCNASIERLKETARVKHLALCTRLPDTIVKEVFRSIVEMKPVQSETLRGLTTSHALVVKLRSNLEDVDTQLRALEIYKARLKIQLERAEAMRSVDEARKGFKRTLDSATLTAASEIQDDEGREVLPLNSGNVEDERMPKSSLSNKALKASASMWAAASSSILTSKIDLRDVSDDFDQFDDDSGQGYESEHIVGEEEDVEAKESQSSMVDYDAYSTDDLENAVEDFGMQAGSRADMLERLNMIRGKASIHERRQFLSTEDDFLATSPRDEPTFDAISQFIRMHPRLHEHILLFSTIELEDFSQALFDANICTRAALVRYLEHQRISYSKRWR